MGNNRPFFPVEIRTTCENHALGGKKKEKSIRNLKQKEKAFIGKNM